LSDYIHSKGLKLGLYSDAGYTTCGGFTGSRGHEFQDAIMLARLGCDYLKYDWCNTDGINAAGAYTTMRDAIHAAGRPWSSACVNGEIVNHGYGLHLSVICGERPEILRHAGIASIHMAERTIHTESCKYSICRMGFAHMPARTLERSGYARGRNGNLTMNESRAHFSLWAMLAAPLIAGNDLRKMPKDILTLLTNKEVIAIDQDSLGIQGFRQNRIDSVDVWYKPLKSGDWAVCFFNRGSKLAELNYDWNGQVIHDALANLDLRFDKQTYTLHDCWAQKDIGCTDMVLHTKYHRTTYFCSD